MNDRGEMNVGWIERQTDDEGIDHVWKMNFGLKDNECR